MKCKYPRTTYEAFNDADRARWLEGPDELPGGVGVLLLAALFTVGLVVLAVVLA